MHRAVACSRSNSTVGRGQGCHPRKIAAQEPPIGAGLVGAEEARDHPQTSQQAVRAEDLLFGPEGIRADRMKP